MSEPTSPEQKPARDERGTTRRRFVLGSLAGIGVLLGSGYLGRHAIRRYLAGGAERRKPSYAGDTNRPTLWFELTADNVVTLYSPKVEMGQGAFTGLAQIAADELEVDIAQLRVVHAPTASGNVDPGGTGGSTSIASLWQPLRELAATMRELIKREAAKQLGVAVSDLKVEAGRVSAGEKTLTYGEVVAKVQDWGEVPEPPPLKRLADYRYIGKPIARVDLREKVLGAPIFGMDATLPDMLYGAVVRPTQIGARLLGADTAAAEAMPGVVQVVKEPDFVGVVAHSRMAADAAKQAIEAEWDVPRRFQLADIEAMIEVGKGDPVEIQRTGDPADLLDDSPEVIRAEFRSPIGAHAQLEPNGALASVADGRATVVMSTQVARLTRDEIAERLGIDKELVDIRPTYLGGGFGRRLHTPHAIEAAVLSKAVGKPVKCFFDRQEEFQSDTFRPPTHHVLKARLGPGGAIAAIEHNVSSGDVMFGSPLIPEVVGAALGSDFGAWRGGMIQYRAIPNFRAISWRVKLPFATSWWRSLGLLANTFAIESFIDELAQRAGADAVQFRLKHLAGDDYGRRLRAVIERAAERAGYREEVQAGRAMGLAASVDVGTPCAQVAEVSLEGGEIRVHKVTCAIDPGVVVNPDQVRAQCEGAIIMGMSAALYERMTVQDNVLLPVIYGPYRMATMRDAPREIDIDILQGADRPHGVGEPPLGPIGAAIANAVARLTGKRPRAMPLMGEV